MEAMTKLTIPIGVALLASLTAARADTYLYSCKVGKNNLPLVVDDEEMTLGWQGVKHAPITNAMEDDPPGCGRAGWNVNDGEQSFKFCTATKGYGAIEKKDKVVTTCDLQATFTNPYPPEPQKQESAKPSDPIADALNKPAPQSVPQPTSGNWIDKLMAQQKALADANKPPPPRSQIEERLGARMVSPSEYHPSHPIEPEPAPPAPTQNEPLSCSSDGVKNILYNGTFGKFQSYVEQYKKHGNANSPAGIALEQVSHWRGTVANIRETNRTPGSVSCAAEFEWSNMPSRESLQMVGMILLTEGIKDPSCIQINYKVEPLLDKPGQIYVTWRCNDG
jgi:hypothetical protein